MCLETPGSVNVLRSLDADVRRAQFTHVTVPSALQASM